jgi:hypothetical protein
LIGKSVGPELVKMCSQGSSGSIYLDLPFVYKYPTTDWQSPTMIDWEYEGQEYESELFEKIMNDPPIWIINYSSFAPLNSE